MFNPDPIDISFLPCVCLWQISQIQTCLRVVVGHGCVSISPAFNRSSASDPVGLHGHLAQIHNLLYVSLNITTILKKDKIMRREKEV